ncbi:hypothetical protein [Sandaracinus amylolyticus]|uniref:Uncharacterized protein n=1 Tax=Sandaracinus amylolyticus TaxID=927083 RepID=A0A0F6VZG8_9BACT|nr:hypothetical protein [Sandaracinus amylolyticus]AKF03440.1 hypothetical protein DB32_000589 [Sandaracinus amylolyticus]
MRAVLASGAFAVWAAHVLVMWLVYQGSAYELLWACHLAPLLLTLGIALGSVSLTSVAAIWTTLGTTMWLGNLIALGRAPEPTPLLVHAGTLGLALLAVRTIGWDPRAWWRASLALLALACVTRLVPGAALYNVNLVFRVWPGFEAAFPHLVPFLAFVAVMIVIATYVIGRALDQLGARGEVASRSWSRSRPSSRTS